MNFRMMLLAGVSVGTVVFVAAAMPAMARGAPPRIHVAVKRTDTAPGVRIHQKTRIGKGGFENYTSSATFTATLSETAVYQKTVPILAQTWYNSSYCSQATNEKWKNLPKKTAYAKITTGVSTGTITACPGTTFKFHDINYRLQNATATNDRVTGELDAKNFDGYDLRLLTTLNIVIGQ